jgi:uncharacterized membrane protein
MNRKQTLVLAVFLFFVWLLFISVLRANLSDTPDSVRWFNDHNDRWIYMLRGEWLPLGGIPYKDVLSEYPQLPTYLFGLLHLLVRSNSEQMVYFWHSSFFSFMMLIFLLMTIRLLYEMLPERKWMACLMLLPASLYFTYNRFDILPAFLCLWSLWLLKRQKHVLSAIVLGVGALTKWYPALLLPIYLSYDYALNKRLNWNMVVSFSVTCILIMLPTLVMGGADAVLSPFILHAERGMEQISLPVLLNVVLSWLKITPNLTQIKYTFLILQLVMVPVSLFVRIDTFEKVLQWEILVLVFFILFSRIYSPQWILWLMPVMILSIRTRFDLAWIVVYNVVVYLAFPVAVDLRGIDSLEYKLAGEANMIVLAVILGIALYRANIHFTWNFVHFMRGRLSNLFRSKSARKLSCRRPTRRKRV